MPRMIMTRGATTTFILEPRGLPLTDYEKIIVVIKQTKSASDVEVIRTGDDLTISDDVVKCRALTQEESRLFDADKTAEIQLAVRYSDGSVVYSEIAKIDVNRCLYNHVI